MSRNPIIPFLLIMAFGIALVFGLSLKGLGDAKEVANGGKEGEEEQVEQVAGTPEEIYQTSCLGCHGGNYEGGAGPALTDVGDRLSVEEIETILKEGKGTMPANLVPDETKRVEMAEWLSSL